MKTLINASATTLLIIAFLGLTTLKAQEWTKEQKEVWNEVEKMFTNWKNGDFDASFINVHEKYLGWNDESPLPLSKDLWMESTKDFDKYTTERGFYAEPARIVVVGDAAVVHYYYSFWWVYEKGDKKKKGDTKGKWSEFFIRENGKWMLLGDMTLSEKDDD